MMKEIDFGDTLAFEMAIPPNPTPWQMEAHYECFGKAFNEYLWRQITPQQLYAETLMETAKTFIIERLGGRHLSAEQLAMYIALFCREYPVQWRDEW